MTAEEIKQRLMIVDDDEAMRGSLSLLMSSVGYEVDIYPSAIEFLEHYNDQCRGCMILDIRMPGMSGLELQHKLSQLGSHIKIIFITGHGDVQMAVQAMKEGAVDLLEKPFRDQDLIDKVNQAFEKISNEQQNLEQKAEANRKLDTLTSREKEVLRCIVQGKANKVIAIDLNISVRTVEVHRANLMKKMGVRSVSELTCAAMSLKE